LRACGDIPYHVDLEHARKAIVESGASKVVVQLPDGLKQYSIDIVECLKSMVPEDVEVYVHADSVYGSCDIQYGQLWATLKPSLIVHIGHSPYPSELAGSFVEPWRGLGVRVVYVKALSKLAVSREVVREAAETLKGHGVRVVGLVTTAQHTHILGEVAGFLEGEGLKPVIPGGFKHYFEDGQVIGCDYRLARLLKVDGFAYVGGGVFHPLGLYLATFKPVVKVDPYEGRAVDMTPEGERVYKVRLYKVTEAFKADRWAVIVGLKTGQYRPWLVDRITREMEARGKRYVLVASENLTLQNLIAVDSGWVQAFSVTSCPRLPTDDYWDYHKPVLTPGETIMALRGELEPYRFPW
jgi:2-(3-amino-3-carboxypropyl)histidine synthase